MRRDVTMVEGNLQRKETLEGSQKVVAFAITSNFLMFSGKLYAAIVSGSSSMFSEALHSLADILNECLLMWGILRSLRQPDPDHPYGFTMERYAWALVSGVGIFFLGGGVSIYHGVSSIIYPHALGDPTMAWYVLGASLLFEGATMTYAFRTIRKAAIQNDVSTKEYVLRGADPTTVQVLLEDVAAVTGILIAGISISLSSYLAMPILDSIGSISIGLLLGSVAGFLVKRNISSLVERRMDLRKEREIVRVLSEDPVVKSVHDVKTTMLGGEWVRFKAEILFQGDHITERYLHSLSTEELEKELLILKNSKTDEEIKEWVVKHGSGVIGMLGSEVDRLEWEIKKAVPQVKHCDLEIL
ncbi:hypothetical protein HDU92_007591 [Lobulomyces angularis]|nr:hypothetical protein HDU92_007591 [Lobulomyces angularis]